MRVAKNVSRRPDIDYTASVDRVSEIYVGFLFLGQLYRHKTGRSLAFIPLCIDERDKTIYECDAVIVNDFKSEHESVAVYIKKQINGQK